MNWFSKVFLMVLFLGHTFFMLFPPGTNATVTTELQLQKQLLMRYSDSLQSGDIVVRRHADRISEFIRSLNQQEQEFSHAGIVVYDNGIPMVWHIFHDDKSKEALHTEPLPEYCSPDNNTAFGIYRFSLSLSEKKSLDSVIRSYRRKHVQFDLSFDLNTEDSLYCSEMISKAFSIASQGRIKMETTRVPADKAAVIANYLHCPVAKIEGRPFVAIDNLYKNPLCRQIAYCQFGND